MEGGDVLAGRFAIERLAGSGGMGTVYRAIDRVQGGPVAIKVVAGGDSEDERFVQEARVLSELNHPAIVRYVAHGLTPRGEAFLAMEWLEGEDLQQRLARSGLSASESIDMAMRVAEGLAAAHARSVIHRDVKPSNVFLPGGDPSRAKLIDFGIVRLTASGFAPTARALTRTGVLLGTVGYMSPEQAIADRTLDVRTDVFALGCVLFECLTGEHAFSGAHVVAVLAKILREEAPRLRQLRPELPVALDDLVGRMLSKDKTARPADGSAVLRELEAFQSLGGGAPRMASRPPPGLSGGEQRLVSVLLAVVPELAEGDDRASEIVRRHGGDAVRLANGTLMVTVGGRRSMSDQVVTAASCALELCMAYPTARVSLATGRALATAGGPPGPIIDQAAGLLAQSAATGIRIDQVTAGFLGERFDVRRDARGNVLLARRTEGQTFRALMGKPMPCVGREKEITLLDGTLRECIDESVARVVLVTGPAGQGKSRLRHEFEHKARERGDVTVLTAHADPVGAGSAFMLARQLVRQAVGLAGDDAVPEQDRKLRARIAHVCKGLEVQRIADFLGELVGVPSTSQPSPQLRAARNDPQIMAVWLGRSFGEWLAAECAARPLVVVLEDLHWGDLPSVTYIGEGLRALAARPFMVLALARPEVHDTFPDLWAAAEPSEIALGRLTPRAAERLARAALGESFSRDVLARVVERADGNAFYLEELIRLVAEGGGDSLPETVLALVQSRLEQMEPAARRIVRAASVFGESFWQRGVQVLVGKGGEDTGEWLEMLVKREVFAESRVSRFPGSREYSFRHSLLREAAYAMLTDADRITGHRLAAEWLGAAGEKDALIIADHFERAHEGGKAVPWLLRAAQMEVDGGNDQAAIALGQRGVTCGPDDAERGLIRLVQTQAFVMRGDWPGVVEAGREAMALLPNGSIQWFLGAVGVFAAGMFLSDPTVTGPVLQAILGCSVQPEPSGPYATAVCWVCIGLGTMGKVDLARSFVQRAEALGNGTASDPVFVLRLLIARAYLQLLDADLGPTMSSLSRARFQADRTADAFGRGLADAFTVLTHKETGRCDRAEHVAGEWLDFRKPTGPDMLSDWVVFFLAGARLNDGRAADVVASLQSLLDRRDSFLVACARALLSQALLATGDSAGATREAEASAEQGQMYPLALAMAFGSSALIELHRGRP
ncbi:MAG TPA: protein kinase, partial [Polyangiaceae bacterium]